MEENSKARHEYILEEVEDLMGYSMEGFGLDQIIDCSEKLTQREKAWAKKHISWKVYIVDDKEEELMKGYYLLYKNENGVDTWPIQNDETFEEALERVMKEVGDEPQDLEDEASYVCGLIIENGKKPETIEVGYPDWYVDSRDQEE